MTAEVLIEIYRTNEDKSTYTFSAVVTISYFGNTATLQGMSGSFNKKSLMEIIHHLRSRNIKTIKYIRKGVLKEVDITVRDRELR